MNIERMYKFIVMEHINSPLNKNINLNESNSLKVNNDSCGDRIYLQCEIEDNKISKVSWNGSGCSLSMSVCSIMSQTLIGKTVTEAKYFLSEYEKMVLGQDYDQNLDFGELQVMANQLPARYKCATLFKQGIDFYIVAKEETNGN